MERLTGIPVSDGMAWGPAVLLLQHPLAVRYAVASVHVPREIARLNRAREASHRQLADIRTRVATSAGSDLAQLFEAQLLMLDDRLLVPRAREIIAAERVNAEWAVQKAFDEVSAVFAGAGDDYLHERRGDVADVVGRLRRNLYTASGGRLDLLLDLDEGSILVADDLPPSVTGQLDRRRVIGLATDTGSRTHHSAILARSLGLPAVAGLARASELVHPGTIVIVDGTAGELIIDPSPDVLEAVRARRVTRRTRAPGAVELSAAPILTADGVPIRIDANVELPSEVAGARAAGAQGIGLFRSEFMLRSQPIADIDVDAQYETYRDMVQRMAPLPVTIRTFDLDESQLPGGRLDLRGADAGGPAVARGPLGMRAIRLSLSRAELFRTQLTAIVRAARHGPVRVLFPFVTSVEELRAAKAVLREVQSVVATADGRDPDIPVGAMIEVPSAALTVDLLAEEADFFSIGTNDLVQYCLAVDRTDGRMAHLYEPLHPAVLRMIRLVARTATARRKDVAVCGEMAADPVSLALLIGLGVTAFSMNPASIPAARRMIGRVTIPELRRIARAALRQRTASDVGTLILDALGSIGEAVSGLASGGEGDNGE